MDKVKEAAVDKANNGASPPTYHDTPTSSPPPTGDEPPPSDYTIFPRDTVIYRTTYISLILGPQYEAHKPQPPALFYVSIHMDNRFTNNSKIPQIRLHYGPDDTYPLIGTVKFRANTTSDVTLWHDAQATGTETSKYAAEQNKNSEAKIELKKGGILSSDVHTFRHRVQTSDGKPAQLESFEWRHSGDPEVAALAMENLPGEDITQEARGLKLMRVSIGQTLAAFAGGKHQRKLNPRRVAGKLRFVGQPVLDPLVVVLTILSIMERARRNATWNASQIIGCSIS